MERKIITQQEADEAGVNRDVYQDWLDIMQAMWTAAIATYSHDTKDNLLPMQGDNVIKIGFRFTIKANMVNNKYVTCILLDEETELITMRYEGFSVTFMTIIFFKIINERLKD